MYVVTLTADSNYGIKTVDQFWVTPYYKRQNEMWINFFVSGLFACD